MVGRKHAGEEREEGWELLMHKGSARGSRLIQTV